ncbi:prepilin-type N-terminal cleavage/methylation domain-containing protein [Candidatus Saccharibacteria bacterium]|nr:prepilin-type N-terminal cleavage/methylation domain-containing protein [Candidatus Saccharibacteria bacterium]
MRRLDSGFSAVEVLITLSIGSVFLFSGYQLSTQVTADGTDSAITGKVSNVVYDYLRKARFDSVDGGCIVASPPTASSDQVTIPGLQTTATVTTTYACVYDQVDIYKVTVSASYNDGISTKVLSHAIYTN